MSTKPVAEKEPATVVANDPDDLKGMLKAIGGSRSDLWNNILANQTVQALWLKHFDPETQNKQYSATVAALIGIGPKDELEGMMAAQLIAAHNASMECYRRAMLPEQTFEGRRENLSQANKLSRTYAVLLDGLNRHRGKGQQKVMVEHVHVHAGGQAVVGMVETPGGGNVGRARLAEAVLSAAEALRVAHKTWASLFLTEEEDGADTMTTPEEQNQWSTSNVLSPTPNLTRDQRGRFLTGNSGGGRRKGSRNKLSELFLDAIADDFAEHGAEAIANVRTTDPATYLKIVGSLIPRNLILDREYGPGAIGKVNASTNNYVNAMTIRFVKPEPNK